MVDLVTPGAVGPEDASDASAALRRGLSSGPPAGAPEDVTPFPEGLPPSAKQVYTTLAIRGPLTHKDLVGVTGMPGRTVRYAVGRLKEAGVIGARCNLMDCRQCYFFVAQQCPGEGRSPFVKTRWGAL